MAIRPFANAPHADKNDISVSWLIGVQTGNTPNAVNQMKYLTVDEFTAYVRSTYGSMWNYRGESNSATPTDPMHNDYFVCTGSFTESGQSFVSGHVYAYNGNTWDDVSNVLNQYAQQSTVNSISSRVSVVEAVLPTTVKKADIVDALNSSDADKVLSAKQGKVLDEKIAAISGGVIFKGECTYAELLAIQNHEAGWEYWVTDKEAFYLYSVDDGWVETAGTVVQTPDETDVTHALSNAVTTQIVENAKGAGIKANHRIDNMQDIEGSYEVKNYKDGSVTPSGKGAWAIVEGLRGVSRVENQLAKAINATNWEFGGSTGSFADGVASFTASGRYGCVRLFGDARFNLVANHNYLISAEIKTTTAITSVKLALNWNAGVGESAVAVASSTSWQAVSFIVPFGATNYNDGYVQIFDARSGSWDAVQVKNVIIRDLTLYFGGTIPSDADTIAEIQTNYPHLLLPSDYGTRMVDTTVEGVKSVGVNIFDGLTELGDLNNGVEVPASNRIRAVNYCDVEPSTGYYILSVNNATVNVAYFDANKNFISDESKKGKITTPSGCYYIRIWFPPNYGTTYQDDIQMTLDNYADKTTYHPYMTDTLTLTFTGKSAGSVAEMYYPETGEVTHPLAEVDFSTLSWVTDANRARTSSLASVIKKPADPDSLGNYLSGKGYTQVPARTSLSQEGQYAVLSDDGQIIFYYTGTLPSGLFRYELATPDPSTYVTPIIDNTLLTEAGGRLSTVQTGTVVDGSFDMGFYAEKPQLQEKLEDGTIVVGKAQKDASGNVITSTYATKSELSSEATARANADTNLKSAFEALGLSIVGGKVAQTITY